MRVQAENFQCFAKLDIHLSGFTAIVGPTNNGKSALTRVLRTALYNDWHPSFIRGGAKRTAVEVTDFVETPNGITQISLAKADSVNSFQVTSALGTETYPKVGTGVPEDITNAGFSLFQTDKGDHNLNFQTQFDKLFLLTEGYTAFTSFFNSLFKIDRYETALQFLTSDQTRKRSEHSKLAEEEGPLFKKTEDLSDKFNSLNDSQNILQELSKAQTAAYDNVILATELADNIVRTSNSLNTAKAELTSASSFKTETEESLGRAEEILTHVPFNLGSIEAISAHQQSLLSQTHELTQAHDSESLFNHTIPKLQEALLAANLTDAKVKLEAQLAGEQAAIESSESSLDFIHSGLRGLETTVRLHHILRDLEVTTRDRALLQGQLSFLQTSDNLAEAITLASAKFIEASHSIISINDPLQAATETRAEISRLEETLTTVSAFVKAYETELATLTIACPHCHTPLSDEDILKICQHHGAIK